MRYASYLTTDGTPTWGAEADGVLHDLGPSGTGVAPIMGGRRVRCRKRQEFSSHVDV